MRTVNPEQHARKRQAIIEAAAVEFAVNGVDGASTAAICRRAGIGSGTLFHYFPTKIDIFHALFQGDLVRNAAACREALEQPAVEGLWHVVDLLVTDLGDPLVPGLLAAALLQVNRDPAFAAMLAEDETVVRATLTALLQRMVDDGGSLPFPPLRTAGWIQHLVDAGFFAAGDDDFDAAVTLAELRNMIGWLAGGRARRDQQPVTS